MAILANRVKVGTTTTGTGTMTLGAASSAAFCTFAEAGVANSETVTYCIEEGNNFEIGRGVYTTSGTTLTRATVLLSKIGGTAGTTKMTLAGAATVRIVAAAEDVPGTKATETANTILAGPTSGGAARPTFRALVAADLPAASDSAQGAQQNADQTAMEAGSSTTTTVTPGRQQFHPSAAKGWVNFNGTGTVAIRRSYNVSSITDNGAGDYTVNWTTAFSDANYSIGGMTCTDSVQQTWVLVQDFSRMAAGSVRVNTPHLSASVDRTVVMVQAYGDQ